MKPAAFRLPRRPPRFPPPPPEQPAASWTPPGWRRVVPGASMADVAALQRGLIATDQLCGLGLSSSAISRAVAARRLHRLFRGVYVVGHPLLLPFARELGAVMACGAGAVVSHRSALALWGVHSSNEGAVDVTLSVGGSRPRAGIRVHRDRLSLADVVAREGIPVTSCARTLADVASLVSRVELERAVNEAYVARLTTSEELAAASAKRGARPLRELLEQQSGPSLTRSEAERKLLQLANRAGLPRPETNRIVGGFEVDALWPRQRLIVEVDGYAFHGTRKAFERDRARDAHLQGLGFRVVRVTWRQLISDRERVVASIAGALAAR